MNVFEKIRENLTKALSWEDIDGKPRFTFRDKQMLHTAIAIVDKTEMEYNDGWIPCSERLPGVAEDGLSEELLVIDKDNSIWTGEYYQKSNKWLDTVNGIRIDAVAWMPLPEPYKEE